MIKTKDGWGGKINLTIVFTDSSSNPVDSNWATGNVIGKLNIVVVKVLKFLSKISKLLF